ncbi:MAG: nucleotidyl transferase AbiEii/AbiGii toxin family protein [Casimicrobiaceae bacterium]
MAKTLRNIGASVRARLLTLSRENGQTLDLLLTRYALERLLYRLSISPHRDRFVLKGAMLITTWFDDPHRATRDVDLLGYGDPSSEPMLATFREIASIAADDGLTFDTEALRVDLIREELVYGGLRLRTTAALASARISVVIDIGFGDAVEPGIEEIDLPVLLDLPAPHLRAYARETVIAEKFQAMVALGRANSRMKDFYDVWVLAKRYDFDDDRLPRAIAATFDRRGTPLPAVLPDALTAEFARDEAKRRQWSAFSTDLAVPTGRFDDVIEDLANILMPKVAQARDISKADK